MTALDRQPFINKAEELRIQHMQTYPDYKYRPRRRPKNKHAKVKAGQTTPLYPNRMSPSCGTPPGLTPPTTPTKLAPLDMAHIKTEDTGPCSAVSSYSPPYQPYPDATPTEYNNNSFVFPSQFKTYYPPSCYYSEVGSNEPYYPARPSSISPGYPSPVQHPEVSSATLCNGPSFIQQLIGFDDYKDIQPAEFDQYLTDEKMTSQMSERAAEKSEAATVNSNTLSTA